MSDKDITVADLIEQRNEEKFLFTAGPASLLSENIMGLRPCFGRGDSDYTAVENHVMTALQRMSGHDHVVRMQGSGSLGLEVMALNFLYGRVLVVETGYYSERLAYLSQSAQRRLDAVKKVDYVRWDQLENTTGTYDWVVACYTETSCGLKMPIEILRSFADRLSAKLMIDATASIGLEERHDLADAISYSSCKGLFGLTGAAFIAFNENPSVEVDSFYLDINKHIQKMMTGPYHAIASLYEVLDKHSDFKSAVIENKRVFAQKMNKYLTIPLDFQPLICTHVNCKIKTNDKRAVLYSPRTANTGSVICHLGEAHLGIEARGEILSVLEVDSETHYG